MRFRTETMLLLITATLASPPVVRAQTPVPPAVAQTPSPMAETTRAHERLVPRPFDGLARTFTGPADKPAELRIPSSVRADRRLNLVIHFHGAAWVVEQAIAARHDNTIAVIVNLGSGSGAYHRPFADPATFDSLLARTGAAFQAATGHALQTDRITLTGFSAGHGAIRAILLDSAHAARITAILLLDGMHTSYVPEGRVLADSGVLDTTNLVAFAAFARRAVASQARFLITHSEIFPGTFASTTETADWMLRSLGLRRTPLLRWGPRGMQQLSTVRSGQFLLHGYAGNSAPDHVDQLHAMPELLDLLLRR